MSKQTALEFLIEYMEANFYLTDESRAKFEEAKTIEKEQIIDAAYEFMGTNFDPNKGRAEQYYNETYKGDEQ